MAITVADLAGSPAPTMVSAAEAPLEEEGLEPSQEDDFHEETMKVLVEEFRSAPAEEASNALEQMVRMLLRKLT